MKVIMTAVFLASTMQFFGGPVPDGAVQVARDYVRYKKDTILGEPYIFYLTNSGAIVEFEGKPVASILRFVLDRRWHFPMIRSDRVERVICVSYTDGEFRLCGTYKSNDFVSAFFDYRRKLASGYELAEYYTHDCGTYWVVHKNETPSKFIATDSKAYRILSGKRIKSVHNRKFGRPYRVDDAAPKILRAAYEAREFYDRIKARDTSKSVEHLELSNWAFLLTARGVFGCVLDYGFYLGR